MASRIRTDHNITRLEISGGIGVGKTTLAKHLCKFQKHSLIEEKLEKVAFWKNFYNAPHRYALEKNIGFLLEHAALISEISSANRQTFVCDFAMYQDLAYAQLGPPNELNQFIELYERVTRRIPPPKIIVHVHCDVQTQMERIRQRGIEQEMKIDINYLTSLNEKIETTMQNINVLILRVDSSIVNFRSDNFRSQEMRRNISMALT